MTKENAIQLFEDKKVRSVWDADAGKWYVSIVDVIEALTESANARRYWSDLKIKLSKEGSQLYENIVQLKLPSADGENYKTDVADVEQLFRLIQSVPPPKIGKWLPRADRSPRPHAKHSKREPENGLYRGSMPR